MSGGLVEVRSRRLEPRWRNFAGRWTCLPTKRTGRRGQLNGVTDVTSPRLGGWLAWGRQDQYLGHSRRSKQQSWTVSSQWLAASEECHEAISLKRMKRQRKLYSNGQYKVIHDVSITAKMLDLEWPLCENGWIEGCYVRLVRAIGCDYFSLVGHMINYYVTGHGSEHSCV